MGDTPLTPAVQDQHAQGARLESWKEIAAYLRRDVRTVQRWERSDGLPIHRHKRAHRAIPYAYKSELDSWWTSRPADKVADQESSPPPATRVAISAYGTLAVAALLVAAAAGVWIAHARSSVAASSAGEMSTITTSSAKALKLYREANDILEQDTSDSAAEALLREAIAADPKFASADILLAWAMLRQGRAKEDYLPYAARAEALAPAASVSERLFILASALGMRGKFRESCAGYRAVLQVDPAHYWAKNNLIHSCRLVDGDWSAFAELLSSRADRHPHSLIDNISAAWSDEFLIGDAWTAKRYVDRAEQLQHDGVYSTFGLADAWLRLRPGYLKWLGNDVDGAIGVLTTVVSRDASRLRAADRNDLFMFAGSFMLTLGRLTDAERLFDRMNQKEWLPGYIGLTAYAGGNIARARRLCLEFSHNFHPRSGPIAATVFVRLGLEDSAREVLRRQPPESAAAEGIVGELAFASGDLRAAIEHLTAAVRVPNGEGQYFAAAETLANVLTASDRAVEAIELLDTAAAQREHAYDPFYSGPICGYFWLRVRLLQAELCARQGRFADSQRIAKELVQLLSRADSDFPILLRARELVSGSRSEPLQ